MQLPGGGYIWYEVAGITPSRERTFDEVKERVETRWRDDQTAERLQTKAADLVARLNSGGSLAEIAQGEGLKVETASELRRAKPSEALTRGLIDEVFRTMKGKAAAGPGQNATQRVVFRVIDVKTPDLNMTSEEAKRIDESLRRSYSDDIINQYVTRLQNELGVTINQAALRQVVGGEAN
jgi:peptidyl-prolyl cis-trans isomerase D